MTSARLSAKRASYVIAAVLLALFGVYLSQTSTARAASTWFVSPSGNNTTGTSWANAWTSPSSISWGSIGSGDTIEFDGGSTTCPTSPYKFSDNGSNNPGVDCGQAYAGFTVGANNVTIVRSTDSGHNGTVVFDSRTNPLPYCNETTATYGSSSGGGSASGIDLNGHSGVTIDGQTRSGIVIRGFGEAGVRMRNGGTDTLRNMEMFDNGHWFQMANSNLSTDGNGVDIGGENNVYDRLLVHDNGQDELHSDGNPYNESGSTVENSWLGAVRSDPAFNYEPFNDEQATGSDPGCQHADAVQIFSPASTVITGLTFDHDVMGPGVNQGLYPNDTPSAVLTSSSSVTDTTFLAPVAHAIEFDHTSGSDPTGWTFTNDTIYTTHGTEIPLGTGTPHGTGTMTSVIKYGGYLTTSGDWTMSGTNCWSGGDALPSPSTNEDPAFTHVDSLASYPPIADLLDSSKTNLTPTSTHCSTIGSPLPTFQSILDRIDALNGAPVVTTDAATSVTSSGATLNGHVNPEGASTTYQFDYGTTTSYGSSTTSSSAGSGSTSVAENAAITGLSASTTYHYRIEATNASGTTLGSDQTFTTSAAAQAPVVTTDAATSVTSSAATLNGHVNPESQSTTYQFDWGTTTSYGSSTTSSSAGSGSSSVAESANLTGLSASTTYHYRIEATNATGTTLGSDQQFTTSGTTCTIATGTSPAAVHSGFGVGTATTASFSPPAGSLVEVQLNTLQGAAGGVTTSVKDSLNNSYTAGPSKEASNAPVGVWLYQHYYTTAPGSITVTATQTGSNKGTVQLVAKVLTGAAASQTGAATATHDSGATSTTNQSLSITTTTTGSVVAVSAANGDSGAALTAQTGTTNNDVWLDTAHSGNAGATGKSTSATGTPGATTFGWTSASMDEYAAAAQEILPATTC